MPSNAYNLEQAKRQPLTKKNLRELDIEQTWRSILDHPNLVYVDDYGVKHKPVGFSVNKSSFGAFPGTAHQLGWLAYMNLGEPLIEQRGNISQPPPETFSSRSYVNRSLTSTMTFTDSVEFTVSNAVTWSLQGEAQLTFGGSVSAELQLQLQAQLQVALQTQLQTQLQNDLENKNTTTTTNENSKDDIGVDTSNATETGVKNSATNSAANSVESTAAFTTQGSATGNATLNAQLALGITASVGGTLTTGWASNSQISGEIPPNTRIGTLATQRRTRKQYVYEIPVTFSGLIAVKYDVPVAVLSPPQSGTYPGLAQVVARDIGDIDLGGGAGFRMKGLAEVVSALEVHHTMFDGESLTGSDRELHKQP
ncbi:MULTISPECIES: hypothetical protein [unclassified Streptomyces]|uniref:hypothetical protein n=1 Tax=unclassified Streptomyces TaxID=2593676 RepID=UPI00166066B4|nr:MULTISPECIES: hypothetical protein [unclassified Streptomyces]MBD0707938.1 hypothetical protein [Streptomyces sp. CBMA291]MBD0715968.1 hypothetical protein [Streptomyces sp. CBMA370]